MMLSQKTSVKASRCRSAWRLNIGSSLCKKVWTPISRFYRVQYKWQQHQCTNEFCCWCGRVGTKTTGWFIVPKIKIRNLGPIRKCDIDLNAFTILTGAQASGKSTLAKAIYFFRTLKTDVYEEITRRPSPEDYSDNMINSLEKRIRSKFLRIFGLSLPF